MSIFALLYESDWYFFIYMFYPCFFLHALTFTQSSCCTNILPHTKSIWDFLVLYGIIQVLCSESVSPNGLTLFLLYSKKERISFYKYAVCSDFLLHNTERKVILYDLLKKTDEKILLLQFYPYPCWRSWGCRINGKWLLVWQLFCVRKKQQKTALKCRNITGCWCKIVVWKISYVKSIL